MDSSKQIQTLQNIYAINGQLIRLKHCNNKAYLMSSSIKLQEKKSILQKGLKDTNKTLVGCGKAELESLWQIIRVVPPSKVDQIREYDKTEIMFDDPIMLMNYANSEYLTVDKSSKSQMTEQGLIYCQQEKMNNERQIFMIQRINDPYGSDDVLDERIYSRKILTVISFDTNYSLHSHAINYKQENANNIYEVTSFPKRDENDHWEIILFDKNNLNNESTTLQRDIDDKIPPRIRNFIFNQDEVVIRNAKYGWTLHSHSKDYVTGSKLQEITCRVDALRDDNDWWTIYKVHEDHIDEEVEKVDNNIKNLQRIKLLHKETNKFLTTSTGEKAPSGNGLEVTCYKKQARDEFCLVALRTTYNEQQENLLTEYPFVINHVKTNTFLTCNPIPSKPTSFQYEVALVPEITHAAVWQIEQRNSIFC